jgi:hypothetical protein
LLSISFDPNTSKLVSGTTNSLWQEHQMERVSTILRSVQATGACIRAETWVPQQRDAALATTDYPAAKEAVALLPTAHIADTKRQATFDIVQTAC